MLERVVREQVKGQVLKSVGGVKYKILGFQQHVGTQKTSIYTLPISPPPPSTAFSSGSPKTLLMDLEPMDVPEVLSIELRFSVKASNADVEIVAGPHLINQITVHASQNLGQEIARIYPEQIVAWMWMTGNNEQRKANQDAAKFKEVLYEDATSKYWSTSDTNTIPQDKTVEITIPIPVAFFDLMAIDGRNIRNPIRFKIELSNDVVVSGTSTNLTLENVHFVVRSVDEDRFDIEARDKVQKNYDQKYVYLDCERTIYNDKTLTAGQETRYDLSSFQGKAGFLMVCIKNSTQAASSKTYYDYYEVGPDATFDIQNSAGASQLANGTPVTEEYINRYFVNEVRNRAPKGLYFIPFCEDMRKAIAGSLIGGFNEFVGQKDYLALTFGSAGQAEVHTIARANGANTAGHYRMVSTKNGINDSDLAYNATVANIQDAIKAIPAIAERNYSVTINTALDAATKNVTATFDANRDGEVSKEVGVVSILPTTLNASGTNDYVSSSTVTTHGRRGWSSGSSYSTEIYMFKFRELTVDKFGNITVRDL